MTATAKAQARPRGDAQDVWRALANPLRRRLLDLLRAGPRTTGELADAAPDLSRFAVMQHLGVLESAGLVVVRPRGRYRFNHLNAVPLREWYERWVTPLADSGAGDMLALKRTIELTTDRGEEESTMAIATDAYRTVRIENELRFRASPERVFEALTTRTLEWFPHTYGEDRVRSVVIEPRVGGAVYEDWGDGMGHLYGHVTVWSPPLGYSTRGRLGPGTILDTEYALEPDGGETVLRVSKVAAGPISEDEATGIRTFGDLARFEAALRAVVER